MEVAAAVAALGELGARIVLTEGGPTLIGQLAVADVIDELCLSVKTISTYRSRLMDKMNMKKNAELTLYAVRNRLVGDSTETY